MTPGLRRPIGKRSEPGVSSTARQRLSQVYKALAASQHEEKALRTMIDVLSAFLRI